MGRELCHLGQTLLGERPRAAPRQAHEPPLPLDSVISVVVAIGYTAALVLRFMDIQGIPPDWWLGFAISLPVIIGVHLLANLIFGPSYISLESALSLHGLIPERVETVTSVTFKKNKMFKNEKARWMKLECP